jgi:Mor family transcriptional regulator
MPAADGSANGAGDAVALAAAGERIRAERDWAIRGAHHHGVPVASIARMMKMSVQSVARIVSGRARL